MKIPDVTIVIPAAIAALPDLSLAERVALAHIADHSACSNGDLARLLGISVRGVEQMVRRFRARGLIQQTGNGHARVFRLLFPVEHHSKCEEHQGAKPHTKSGKHEPGESHRSCGPSARPAANHPVATQAQDTPQSDDTLSPRAKIKREYKRARDCVDRRDLAGALGHYRLLKEQISSLPDGGAKYKSEFIAAVEEEETRVLACKLLFQQARARKMPRQMFNTLVRAIPHLGEQRLSQIRPALDAQERLGTPGDISALLVP